MFGTLCAAKAQTVKMTAEVGGIRGPQRHCMLETSHNAFDAKPSVKRSQFNDESFCGCLNSLFAVDICKSLHLTTVIPWSLSHSLLRIAATISDRPDSLNHGQSLIHSVRYNSNSTGPLFSKAANFINY
jgi:hypothetical protein